MSENSSESPQELPPETRTPAPFEQPKEQAIDQRLYSVTTDTKRLIAITGSKEEAARLLAELFSKELTDENGEPLITLAKQEDPSA